MNIKPKIIYKRLVFILGLCYNIIKRSEIMDKLLEQLNEVYRTQINDIIPRLKHKKEEYTLKLQDKQHISYSDYIDIEFALEIIEKQLQYEQGVADGLFEAREKLLDLL